MPLNANKKSEKGQILLIVVLAAVISLTVGLSAVSRSITNTRVSTEEANSQKALAAAEAGVEEQINKSSITQDTSKDISSNVSFNAKGEPVQGTDFAMNDGNPITKDVGADIWLSTYPNFDSPTLSTTLTVFWKAVTPCNTAEAAIEIAVISGADKTDPSMARYAVDACSSRRTGANGNNFDDVRGTRLPPAGFTHQYEIPDTINNGYIVRVIPLYASTPIAVHSSTGLPPQGHIIKSTGKAGNTVRQVRVYKGYPALPVEFFPYNLFIP